MKSQSNSTLGSNFLRRKSSSCNLLDTFWSGFITLDKFSAQLITVKTLIYPIAFNPFTLAFLYAWSVKKCARVMLVNRFSCAQCLKIVNSATFCEDLGSHIMGMWRNTRVWFFFHWPFLKGIDSISLVPLWCQLVWDHLSYRDATMEEHCIRLTDIFLLLTLFSCIACRKELLLR